jgi:hypothetical protein
MFSTFQATLHGPRVPTALLPSLRRQGKMSSLIIDQSCGAVTTDETKDRKEMVSLWANKPVLD